jgi:hypothetical protein
VCSAYISSECTQAKGADACLVELVAQLHAQNVFGHQKLLIGLLVPLSVCSEHSRCSGYLSTPAQRWLRCTSTSCL